LTAILLGSTSMAQEFAPDRAVVFKTIGEVQLKLHIFEPDGHQASDPKPTIVFFFGGGWTGGTPRQFYQQATELADQGMVAISAEYRVSSRHKTTPFESVQDAKSAVRWIRQHAGELGINPDQIVASGGSAGGHVAACTGVITGHEEQGEDLEISSIPNAMILFNPVLDTTAKGYGLKKVGEARQTDISPCHQVRSGIVPTLLLHGTADTTVPFENAERFTRLMTEASNICELKAYEGAGHGFFNGNFFRPKTKDTTPYEKAMAQSLAFLRTHEFLPSPPAEEADNTKAAE